MGVCGGIWGGVCLCGVGGGVCVCVCVCVGGGLVYDGPEDMGLLTPETLQASKPQQEPQQAATRAATSRNKRHNTPQQAATSRNKRRNTPLRATPIEPKARAAAAAAPPWAGSMGLPPRPSGPNHWSPRHRSPGGTGLPVPLASLLPGGCRA